MASSDDTSNDEIQEALVFTRNFKKQGGDLSSSSITTAASSCDSNCDCYINVEWTTAAGIAGYRYGS